MIGIIPEVSESVLQKTGMHDEVGFARTDTQTKLLKSKKQRIETLLVIRPAQEVEDAIICEGPAM